MKRVLILSAWSVTASLCGADPAALTALAIEPSAAKADVAPRPKAVLELKGIRVEEKADGDSARHLALHIPLKRVPDAQIEPKEMVIHVLFYDVIGGEQVEQTVAEVHSHWDDPPADWTRRDVEELVVDYRLPQAAAVTAKGEERKYYGYLVRLYYRGELQGDTSDQPRLLQQYPSPAQLPGGVAPKWKPKAHVTGDKSSFEDGMMIVEGHGHLVLGKHEAWADTIRYDSRLHSAELTGHVEITDGTYRTTGDNLQAEFRPDGSIRIRGQHKTTAIENNPPAPGEKRAGDGAMEILAAMIKGQTLEEEGKTEEAIKQMELAGQKLETLKSAGLNQDADVVIIRRKIADSLQRLRAKQAPKL